MRITGVVLLQQLQQLGVEVLEVGQLRAVELEERTGLHLARQEVVGRHHHVIAGAPGQQLALQGFIGVEHIVDHLDTGLGLEVRQGGLANVIGPVVDTHRRRRLAGTAERRDQGQWEKLVHKTHIVTPFMLVFRRSTAGTHAPRN